MERQVLVSNTAELFTSTTSVSTSHSESNESPSYEVEKHIYDSNNSSPQIKQTKSTDKRIRTDQKCAKLQYEISIPSSLKICWGRIDLKNNESKQLISMLVALLNLGGITKILLGGFKGKNEEIEGSTLKKAFCIASDAIPKEPTTGKRKITGDHFSKLAFRSCLDLECILQIHLLTENAQVFTLETSPFLLASNHKTESSSPSKKAKK